MWDQLVTCNTACKMFETLKEEVSFSVQKYMCISHTRGTFAKECKDTCITAITRRVSTQKKCISCISTVIKRTWNRLIAAWAFKELTNA